jgi:hypothetical protein
MTPGRLRSVIARLPPNGRATAALTRALSAKHGARKTWYRTQKEHWLGWLREYEGPGAYGRQQWRGRDARFVYNHIQCAPMLLWLAEAVGVPRALLVLAKQKVLRAGKSGARQCRALRETIPWEIVDILLSKERSRNVGG